jgi:hypothetical protein
MLAGASRIQKELAGLFVMYLSSLALMTFRHFTVKFHHHHHHHHQTVKEFGRPLTRSPLNSLLVLSTDVLGSYSR